MQLGLWNCPGDRAEFVARLQHDTAVTGFEKKFRAKNGRVWLHQLCARIVQLGGAPHVVAIGRDVTEARRTDDLVLQIAAGVARSTGGTFLQSLIGHLAEALHAELVWVAEVVPGGRLRSLAVYRDGRESDSFEYDLRAAACETHGSGVCIHPSGARSFFPRHAMLQATDGEGYAAVPLSDSKGSHLGSLGVVSRNPISNTQLATSLLQIFAARAATELERKRSDEALLASESRLKILFEYAPDTYYVADLQGTIVDANQAGEVLTGYTRGEVLGRDILEIGLISPADRAKAADRIRRAAAGQTTEAEEFNIVRKDGRHVQVEIRSFPIEIEGERLMLGCVRDITERKRAECESRERHQRIQKLQSAVLQLATHPALAGGDVAGAARCLTESSAAILKLSRVGVWLLHSQDQLVALDEFTPAAAIRKAGRSARKLARSTSTP